MAISYNYNFAQLARDSGFKLRQYKDGPLDWRLIGCLEIERILRDQSLEQIDGVLNHLSEAPLGNILDTNILDSGIAKYFTLSQFSIQYLLFCRKFLDETVRELRDSLMESQLEVGKLKKSLTESNNEILQLNKKITQIEAIHEVVYPCHMCTKNFVSNEALNIHIGRKHNSSSGRGTADTKRNETPLSSSTQRDKDNDRNLINTIKLELEIKQLKERLNVAEKTIKERSGNNSRRPSPRTSTNGRSKLITRDVAIQSNLIEEKEKDDATGSEEESSSSPLALERKEQLMKLHEKIIDFEQWRETQMLNNEESIAEINQKLADISEALESSKQQKLSEQEHRGPSSKQPHMERSMSASVDQLEKLLTEKVAEIGKASAEKLEEVVYHMEKSYKDKLDELEMEIKQRKEVVATRAQIVTMQERETTMTINDGNHHQHHPNHHSRRTEEAATKVTVAKVAAMKMTTAPKEADLEKATTKIAIESETHAKVENTKVATGRTTKVSSSKVPVPITRPHNETYEIETFPEVEVSGHKERANENSSYLAQPSTAAKHLKESLSSESNRTFVKQGESSTSIKEIPKIPQLMLNTEDSTDVSDTLSEEDVLSAEKEDSEEEEENTLTDSSEEQVKSKSSKSFKLPVVETKPAKGAKRYDLEELNGEIQTKKHPPPVKFTRKDAKKLANRKLASIGCDSSATSLSTASFNKFNTELLERRSKLKQKYPTFGATRNRIRKFVDKLCSSKLPENAEAMLRKTQPQRPPGLETMKKLHPDEIKLNDSFDTDLDMDLEQNTSTPRKSGEKKSDDTASALRQRIERVLSSPIRKPDGGQQLAPVPVPRKRVMFNTLDTTTTDFNAASGKHKDPNKELTRL